MIENPFTVGGETGVDGDAGQRDGAMGDGLEGRLVGELMTVRGLCRLGGGVELRLHSWRLGSGGSHVVVAGMGSASL